MNGLSVKVWTFVALLGLVIAIVPAPSPVLAAAPVRSTTSPANLSSSVAVTTNLVITFDQAVEKGTGNITINKFHGGAVQTIDVTSAQVTGWSTTAITIDISDLDAGADYYVNYPSTAFKNSLNEFASAITGSASWLFTTAGTPWSGAGTVGDPWQISSCNQLLSIDGLKVYLNDFFIISNDINCTGTTVYPMKHATSYFNGSLDGDNKTISGLSINCTTTHCGLFAQMSTTATVYDLVFTAPAVSSSTSHVGVIAGQSSTSSTRTTAQLSNIRISGGSISGTNYTGSIVGLAINGVTENVQSSASVSGADYTGGIFGQLGQSSSCTSTSNLTRLSDAQFSGPIGGKSRVGGIVGSFTTNSSEDVCGVFNSTNSGNITATTSCSNVGGVVGSISRGTVHNSSNSGSIAASDCPSTGGVIGGMSGSMSAGASTSSHVSNSWNSGSVSGKWYIGGVVGYCDYGYSTLTRVFNIGSVTSSGGQVGGIIGVSSCVIVDSFSRATVTSTSIAGGAIGDGGGAGGSVVEVQRVYSASNKGFLGRRDTSLLSGALCENSFWDTTLASTTPGTCATSTAPAGKSTTQMQDRATFIAAGWDFVDETGNGTNDHWKIDAAINGGYPYLKDVGVRALSGSDATAPTATWTPPSTPSSSRTLSYTLAFSESVSGIAADDFNNDAGTATGCVFTPSAVSGTSITVSVTCSSDGTVVARLLANAVTDSSSNNGPTSNSDASAVTITSPDTTTTTTTTTTAPAPPAPAPTTTVPATTTTTTTIARTRTLGIAGAAASYSVLMIGPSLLATPSSGGGIVTWTSETPDICSALVITGLSAQSASNTVFRVGYLNSAGTCTITASIAATDTHDAATASVSFAVTKLIARVGIKVGGKINNTPLQAASTWSSVTGETISFWATVSMPFGTRKLVTEANDDVQFINLTPTVCSLSEPTKEPFGMRSYATFRTSGVCEIDLLLPTNAQRTRAVPTSTAKATLLAATRTLWFTDSDTASSIAPTDFDGKSFTAQVSAGASEGQISYASATTDVCTIDRLSGLLRVIKSGTCTLYASVPATVNFASASAAPLSLEVAFEKTVASTTTLAPKKSSPLTTIMPPSSLAKLTPTTIPNVKVQVDTQIILNDDVTEFVVTRDSLISIARNLKLTSGTVRVRTSNGLWTSQNLNEVADIRLPFNPATTALELEFISDGGEPIKFTVPLSMKQNSRLVVNLVAAFGAFGVLWFFIFVLRRRKRDETLPPPPALS